MLNRYDWKNIVKRIIIGVGVAFILFNINKCNTYALTIKTSYYENNINDNRFTGTYNSGTETWIGAQFSSYVNLSSYVNNYDYVFFRLRELNFADTTATLIDNDSVSYCSQYNQYIQTSPINTTVYSCSNTSSSILQNYQFLPFDTTVSVYIQDDRDYGITCFFTSEVENHIMCPLDSNFDFHYDKVKGPVFIFNTLTANSTGKSITYAFKIDKQIFFGNNDSTEIVNGLTGVQSQQSQTNTIISDSNTSSSSTSSGTGLNSMNSQLTQSVDSLASVNTYNTIINNFFTQINSSTCSPISLPMPFVNNQNIVLPCIGTEINNSAPTLWTFWRFLCAGIIGFALWGNLIAFIKGVVDPYNIGANNLPLGGGK